MPASWSLSPFLISLVSIVWYFRDLFRHQLPGDIYDGRWTVALHEHWFQVFRHGASVRNVGFYFPVRDSLGMSDAFLGQGIVHAVARELGAGAVRAWLIAQVVTFLVGALGVAALSRRVLRSTMSQCVFVACTCLSYPLVVQQGHVQLFAMLWLSWIVVAMVDLCREAPAPVWAVPVFFIVPPLLAVSSWYPFALGLVYALFFFAALVAITGRSGLRSLRQGVFGVVAGVRRPHGALSLLAALGLWALTAWIYLPAQGVLPARQWAEVALYSPRLSDLINAADRGGGIWGPLYDRLYPKPGMYNGEQPLGVTPILLMLTIVAGFVLLRLLARGGESTSTSEAGPPPLHVRALGFVAFVAVLATWATIVVDERGLSLWRLFFDYVPAMNSIRAPFRIEILIYPAMVLVVLIAAEALTSGTARDHVSRVPLRRPWQALRGPMAVGLLGAVLLVEMYRPTFSRWTVSELLPASLWAQADVVRDRCSVFTLAYDGDLADRKTGPGSIDGVILSMVTGVPTLDGHSTASPVGHADSATPDALAPDTVHWLRSHGFRGDVCIVSAGKVTTVTVN